MSDVPSHGRLHAAKRGAVLAGLFALLAAPPLGAQQIQTAAEMNGFTEYTTHPEMMEYLQALRASSVDMHLSAYGETRQGREIPYAIFSRPLVSQPWEAALLDRPIVLLAANVHGGERTFREGLLPLMRDLATRGNPVNDLLDELVVLVAPQINPDGFHIDDGQRGNAWGLDLNRDYIKLEQPEIQGYVGNLVNTWHPHVFVDGHNGGSRPYNLNYQCPSHAAAYQQITEVCDFELFPFIDGALEAEGLKSWYYTGGNEEQWNTGGFQARIGRNYGGFANSMGILFEAPGGQSMETGARAGYLGYKAVMDFWAQNADRLMDMIQTARMESLTMGRNGEGEIPVTMEYGAEDRTITYEILDDNDQIVEVTNSNLMKRPIPLQMRERPYAYILPRDAIDAVAMLRRQGITVEQLQEEVTLQVQAYTIEGIEYDSQYNHEAVVIVDVGEVVTIEEDFPADTYIVPTGQMLGRVVTHMLEVETDDNVLYWNTMDAWLPRPDPNEGPGGGGGGGGRGGGGGGGPDLVPIYKLMTPMPLPAKVVP